MNGETAQPELIIFAGPNGSGKTTLTKRFLEDRYSLGTYINADEIALALASSDESLRENVDSLNQAAFWEARRRRQECIDNRETFAFESVFSHPSNIKTLQSAKSVGYWIILYFVSTANPDLNVARVQKRVSEGGHGIPEDIIRARYKRSLSLLPEASLLADETVLFDNSELPMLPVASLRWSDVGTPQITLNKPILNWVNSWADALARKLSEEISKRRE